MLRTALEKLALVSFLLFFSFRPYAQNQALDLTGAGNEVNVTYDLATGPGFTVEQWIYIPVITSGVSLVNQSNTNLAAPLDLYVQADGALNLWTGDGTTTNNTVSSIGTISAATWHHIAVVYDPADVGNERKIYLDGNTTPLIQGASPALANIGPIRIGRRADAFEGDDIYFDEVRIWSTARDGAAINADYNQELIGNEANLDVYLRFENNLDDDAFVNLFQDGNLVAGSVNYVPGAPIQENNYSLLFDGVDEYLTTDNAAAKQINQGTVEAWVQASSSTAVDWSGIVVKQLAYGLFVRSDVNANFGVYDWNTTTFHSSGVNIMDDTWHHVAFTFNNGVVGGSQLYLDGVAVGPAFTYNINAQTNDLVMAAGGPAGTQHLNGGLDEVRIWNTVRSASQINAFKDTEVNPLMPGLIAYYDFSNGPNNGNVSDLKGGNPGLPTNMEIQDDWTPATHGLSPAGPLDTTNPTVSISSSESDPTAANPIPITIIFSEEVAGFELADITVSNGTPGNLNTADNITFTADITPTLGGSVFVDVFSGAATDLTGNFNDNSNSFSITYDLTPPVIVATSLSAARNRIYVEFSENVYGAADGITPVDAGDFTVNTAGGSASVIVNSLNVLSPSEIEFDITISGSPDGAEVVDVTPNATAVYDAVGNAMSVSQIENVTGLIDESVLSFSGNNQYVRVPTEAAFELQQYTMEAWVNFPNASPSGDFYTIVSKGSLSSDGGINRNGYTLLYGDNGGTVGILMGQESSVGTEFFQHAITLSPDTWYHIAGTYDGTTMRIILDGVEVASYSALGATDIDHAGDALDLKIGAFEGTGIADEMRGMIDEVRIWNYARSDAQINALRDEAIDGTQNGLIAYYNFNEASGSTLTDLVAARNGTLQNMDLIGATGNWASGGTILGPVDATAPVITFAQNLQTIGTTIIGGTIDDNFAAIEVSLDGGTTRTSAINNGDGTWGYDMSIDPNFGGEAPYTVNIYAIDDAENEGTVAGNVTIDFQNALDFDGVDDGVNTGITTAYGTANFTWEAWFYSRGTDAVRKIIAKDVSGNDPELTLDIVSGTSLRFKLGSADLQAPINTNEWYHVAAVRDGLNHYLYLNGELVASQTLGGAINHTFTNPITIGMRSAAGSHFNGMIDEVRLWSVARSQADIVANAYTTLTSETGLVRSFSFDQQSGNPIDLTGTADGTFNGAPFYTVSTALDGDAFPPTFISGFPLIDNITGVSFDINVQLNEPGRAYYVLLLDGAAAPTATEVFAATGSGGAIPENAGNWAVLTANTTATINSNTLAASTDYDLYIVAEDDEGTPNEQVVVSQFDVTTLSGPQVFNVTDLGDTGPGTLRQAIIDANADAGATSGLPHIINFTVPGQVTLLDALPTINNHMQFQGDAAGTTIHRDGAQEDFRIFDMGAFTVNIWDIIIDNGRMATANDDGGGIYANGTTLTLFNSVVQNCTAERFGGGIYAIGNSDVTLERVTLYNNQTLNVGGWGGGIGIQTGNLEMLNTTVHGNTSGGNGGGIFIWNGVNFILRNSTVVNNNSGSNGGGIVDQTTTNVYNFTNNIIANNTATGTGNDIFLTSVIFGTNSNNLVEDCGGTGCPIFFSTADPNLGLEQTCGIQTYFPLNIGSPAIESGTTVNAPGDDICENSYNTVPNLGSNNLVPVSAPGAVSTNLALWLRADQGVSGTTQVSQWDDQSPGALNATQATGANQPALTDVAINYNPAITFDGTDDFFTSSLDISPTGSPDLTTIIVFNSDQDANTPFRKLFGHDAGNFHRTIGLDSRSGNNFNYFAGSNGVAGYFNLVAGDNYISTTEYTNTNTFNGYINGNQLVGPNATPITGGQTTLTIGAINSAGSEQWDGQIAEMIMYSGTLTAPERQRIETYLAIKYGISIDQTAATNYIASDGNPVWDGTTNATYNQHIAGIGRDDASQLDQKQSRSSDGRMSMGLGTIAASNQANSNSFASDLAYFIWGDNGLDMAFGARDIANVPATVGGRTARIWRVNEANSDIGNVALQIDLNGEGYPGTFTAGNFVLLVDTDADFSSGAVTFSASNYAGGIVEFSGINLSDGEFLALGINEPPLAPTNLIAYTSGGTAITLEWTDNATNETGYNVERDTDPGFGSPTLVLNGGPANTQSFVDNPGADARVYYRVQPTNGGEDATSYSSSEFGTNLSFAGDALTFDGVNQRVDIPDSDLHSFGDGSTDVPFTVEAWINLDQVNSQGIISKRSGTNEWHMVTSGSGQLSITLADNSASAFLFGETSGFTFQSGEWYHVAFSYDGSGLASGIRLFINGNEEPNNPSSSGSYIAMENTPSNIEIGTVNAGTSFNFDGQIDEIRIWGDTAKNNFSDRFLPLIGNENKLVAYYSFDEGSGDIYDQSINTNNGTLVNGPLFNPSTFTDGVVTNTSDSGAGSLREAITYANTNPGTTIRFSIPGGGPYNIGLATALPDITAAGTIIDGTTQPGWTFGDANNMVTLDGSLLGTNVSGLVIDDVANCEIYGLIVTGFTSISESVASIEINGDNADNAIIGAVNKGNILHNMVSAGISFQDADFLTIQGNRFGTLDGTTRSEINKHVIYGAGTTDNVIIGGDSGAGEGNLISGAGNGRFGLRLNVQGSLFIRGNYIGTNAAGDGQIFNEGGGMYLSGAHSGEIGGAAPGHGNVISGNTTGYGIRLGGSVAVINNIIGLDATGTNAVSNGGEGIIIAGTGGVTVDGNIISANGGDAITSLTGFGNADIINNVIGLDASLSTPHPNAAGIVIDNGPGTDNRFGYKDNPNIIANNTGAAIYLTNTSTGNTFATNQIYNNGTGIDLEAGANGSVAPPTIDNVTATDVSGTGVDGTTIHLYLGDGSGQGQTFIDSTTVSGGIWSIPGLSLLTSDQVVATATNYGAGIGTSTFSAAASIPVQNALAFDGTDDHGSIGSNVFGGPYTGPFTIEAWVNSSLTGNNNAALGSGIFKNMESGSGAIGDLALTINHLGQIGLLNWREAAVDADGYTLSDASIPADTWTHVAASWDGSVNRIFINGVEQSFTTAGTSTGWGAGFEIGRVHTAAQWHYDGTMDELRVWNVARSSVDITNNLFNELDPGSEVNLVAYYQFNESSGVTIPDAKGSFDATWNGPIGTNTSPAWGASTALVNPASIVSTTSDTGAGSLREAINFANANPGTTITFNIGESAPWVISLGSALPQITAAGTIIDGFTQPGWTFGDPNAMVQINGSGIGGNANGINIDAADVEVYGLIFTGFLGNISNGNVYLASDAADNAIIGDATRGNIFHASGGNAIYIVNGDNATIQGNRIGTLDGTTASAMGQHGISTTGEITSLTIGGDFFTGEGNLISGAPANRYGMNLFGSGGSGLSNVTIRGNKIGTNDAANGAIPNTLGGINILGTNSAITIGGPSPSDLNIISGNGSHGIIIQAGNGFDIDGNYIGLQSDGSSALGNAGSGIRINGVASNINIGTNSLNLLSENVGYGILYDGNTSSNTALGTNVFSCNQLGGIGFGSGPLTPGGTIDNIGLTSATISTAAADGSIAFIYLADDGCSNDQGVAFAGSASVTSGQAVISGGFAPGAHYVALIEDVNGFSTFSPSVLANFAVVTNTNDSGADSFREAINYANANPGATILFNIPGTGPWDITLASALPDITGEGTIIDATTQPFWNISTANIPHIIGNAGINDGLNFTENFVEVYGLHISDFNVRGIMFNQLGTDPNGFIFGAPGKGNIITNNGSSGIQVLTYTGGGTIQSNYIGVLPDGTTTSMGHQVGVNLGTSGDNVQIGGLGAGEGNVISNNSTSQIALSNADIASIQGNILGLTPDETTGAGGTNGVNLSTTTGTTVEQNVIADNFNGIRINNASGNTIIRNNIGVASDGTTPFANSNGINIIDNLDSDNNIIGSPGNTSDGNIIAHNSLAGILVDGAGNNGNQIQRNSMFSNAVPAISLAGGAHNGITPPGIDPISAANAVSGTGTDGDVIDLYLSDGTGQGNTWLGSITVSSGVWLVGSLSLNDGDIVVATATNATDGTSQFSAEQTFTLQNALILDGTGDYASSGTIAAVNFDRLDPFTIEAWIQTSASGLLTIAGQQEDVGGGTGYRIFVHDGLFRMSLNNTSGTDQLAVNAENSLINDGQWHHVAVTHDGTGVASGVNMYIDGERYNNEIVNDNLISSTVSTASFSIGSRNDVSQFFNGSIDQVRVWDVERTQNEIYDNAYVTLTSEPNLQLAFDFDQTAGAAVDAVAGNDGTLAGDATYGASTAFDNDIFAPLFSGGFPFIDDITDNDFRINSNANEGSFLWVGVYADGSTPSADDVVNGTGAITFAAALSSSAVTRIGGALTQSTNYDVFFVLEDLSTNRQTLPTLIEITTQASVPYPELEGSGEALTLDGADDFVELPSLDLTGRNAITVEAWINPASIPGGPGTQYATIVGEGTFGAPGSSSVGLYLRASDASPFTSLSTRVDNGSTFEEIYYDGININTGEWIHVAMTWSSGNSVLLYVNGVQVAASSPLAGTINGVIGDLMIGSSDSGSEVNFEGSIDEVRIWDFEMPESSLREYLARKVTNGHPSYANLLAYYRMDDSGDLLNLVDFKNVHNGTINGGAVYSPSGAHLGDESIYEYTYTAGSGRNLGDFSAQNLGIANLPLHIYRINQTPSNNVAVGYNTIDDTEYFGIFAPGQTYQARFEVIGVTPDRRILSRADQADATWQTASGFLGTEVQDNQIIGPVASGNGQFVTATQTLPYPTEIDGGSALSFDGVNDFVDLGGGSDFSGHQNITVEAWINPDYTNVSDHGAIVSNLAPSVGGGGYQLSISNTNVRILYRDDTFTDRELVAGPLPEGEWSHVAGIIENAGVNSNLYIYVNGIQVASALGTTGVPDYSSITNMFIGSNSDGVAGAMPLDREFGGQLDEVRIWNTVLTETDIRDHMIGRIDPDIPVFENLMAAYKFDDADPNNVYDVASSNDGSITEAIKVISAAPQGSGSIYSYSAGPGTLSTAAFGEDIILNYADATNGVHGYLIGGPPDQTAADGFNALDQTKYYGLWAPGNPKVDIRMDYNNGGTPDLNRRIVYRTDATDNAASGGWERVSGLINTDPGIDSVYAYNVIPGEFTTAVLNPASTYPSLADTDPGTALDFGGQPEYVNMQGPPLGTNNTGSYTIEAWINPATFTGANASYGAGIYRSTNGDVIGDHFLSVFPDGRVGFANNRTGGPDASGLHITTASISTGTWVHIAATWDGVGSKIYIDGVEQTLTTANTGGSWGTATEIGRSFTTSDYYFQGQIDELRIWGEAVAEADIIAFANTTDISGHPNYSDMVAYHKFDDGTPSTVVEDVFSNNDGTLSSMDENTDWVASGALANAPEQNALNFDGNDYIDFVRQTFPSGLTFEAWINTTSPANTTAYDGNPALTVIGDNNNAIEGAFGVHDGRVRYTHWTGVSTIFDQIDGTITVNDGEWHHIAVTHKSGSGEVSIYVDGILDVTGLSTIYNTSMAANRVGSSYLDGSGNDNFFTGDIDEVRIWNVALPEDEIRNFLYNDDLSGSTNFGNLVLHYNFNQGSAGGNNTGETAATDQTSNALDGVLNGFALTGPTSNFVTSGNTSFTPTAPALQANNIIVSNIMENTADLAWTNGDGDRRVVLVHEGTGNPFPAPADGSFGEPDQYGLGTDLDGGWFVVYNGYGNSTTVENLSGGTDYEVAVLELNGPPTFDTYNTNTGISNPTAFTTTAPISNFALDFDGINDQAQVSTPAGFPVGAAPRTMELWFKSNVDLSVDTNHGIAQYGTTLNGQMFGLITSSNAPGKLYFFGNNADLAGVTDLVQDQWYHAAVTFDGTNLSLYLDGNLEATTTVSLNTVMSGAGFTIGRRAGLENFWNGQLDEVRIWDYARTETEIQNDMNNQLFGNEPGLVAYYPMSDGTGSTTVTDATGGGNNALLVGMDENTDWVEGPSIAPPNPGSTFFEDFTDAPLPGTASSGPFAFDSGVWDGEGVLESGDIDARGGTGNAARIEPAGGNYILTPPLDQATSFGFWYKGESSGGVYEVLASTDGGTTWDTSLGTINPDPTYQEFTVDLSGFFDPSYTGSVRIEYISGANALFIDDVGADVDIVRPDVTITTLPLTDANVNQGDTDALIYKFQADVSMGTAAFEGFYVTIVGADSLDFQLNGFDFYYNIGSDNFGTATLMGTGSWSPGNPVPRNSIGQLFNDIYPDGTSVFYYVTADISPTANATTFNIDLPDIEQFGFGGGNKIDGGLTAGNNFTIIAGSDMTAPDVISLAATPNPITDVATQFELVVVFNENMDTGIDPTIDFLVEDPSATITFNSGAWDNAQNFRATYDVTDVNVDLADIDVQVSGAQDLAGNAMNVFNGPDVFSIDTENPTITVDAYGTSITSPQLTGTVDDVSASISVDVDGNNYPATNNADGTWTLAAGLIASLADGTYDVVAYATDLSGNLGTDATTDELVISQSVVTLAAEDVTSTSFTARWSEGLDVQTYQVDVSTVADFATFVTGFQSTQINATSIAVTNLDFGTQYYYRVRLVNTSDDVSANSNTTMVRTIVDPETTADSTALVQIFNAINPQGLNWATERLRNWTGVDLDPATRTRVDAVDLSSSNSAGDMPNPFTGGAVGGLSNITVMNLSDNQITGLMDFSGTTINDLNVSGNNLEFDDLEPVAGITVVDYSNQANIQFNETTGGDQIEVRYTNDYSLSITIGGANNVYTWYRNDTPISTGDDFIVNNANTIILAIDFDNMGTFRTEVTNTLVPGLTINVDPQAVLAIADMQVTVSDANGDPLTAPLDGFMLETTRTSTGFRILETLEDVNASTFTFPDVVLGDYIIFIESDISLYIPTYFGNVFEWTEADTLFFRSDDVIEMTMVEVPTPLGPGDGDGNLDVLIEEDFGDDTGSRIDARRRASKRKCGLRRKRSGGRTGQDDDEFELIAYGETDDNGEFQFGFLPQGIYRFFVEYPGIPLDESSFVEFEVGEAGVSDTDFKLQAFATEDGVEVTIEAVLGVILEYFKDLEIYPNPSSEYLNIRYRHLKSGDVTAQLVDLSGNTKWSQDLRNGFDGQLRIDVTDYEEGIYILRFYDRENPQDNVVSFRVIVRD